MKICEYLVEQEISVKPGRPDQYDILRIEQGEFEGQEVEIVFLDCCLMGDVAYIDSDTGEVIGFRLGDK
jgi:hypothetical protein